MKKNPLIALVVLVNFLGYSAVGFAAETSVPSSMPVQQTPQVINNPYGQDIEQMLKVQEDFLRKIKNKHEAQDHTQHVVKTENTYQKAVVLYHQKFRDQARDIFTKVEDSMADYKSTLSYLKVIDESSIEKLRQTMLRIRKLKGTQMVIGLLDEASNLYEKTQYMADDKYFIQLSFQLGKVNQVLQKIKYEKIKASRQLAQEDILDKIAKEASGYDQQIVKLIGTKDYAQAKQKYDEFQKVMTHRLLDFKQDFKVKPIAKPESLFHKMHNDKGYMAQEDAAFREGISLYRQKEFYDAKGIFDQLANQGDPRAIMYSRKIEHILE